MNQEIRVLQIEDSESDAAMVVHLLRKAGYIVNSERVETAEQLHKMLARQPWDVIIADFHLPKFDGRAALRIVQNTGKDIPFIIVSGMIGEDVAVEMMKSGAHDYLLKDRLERLAPAVEREIREAKIRKRHREAEEERSEAHSELAAINANAPVLLLVMNAESHVEKVNNLAAQMSGRPAHELIGSSLGDVIRCLSVADDPAGCGAGPACANCSIRNAAVETLKSGTKFESVEGKIPVLVDGERKERHLLFSCTPLVLGRNRKALLCAQDVTPLKRAEQALQAMVDKLELALTEKAVLFQEVHHRVKNNLQIIASLLSMQSRTIEDRRAAEKLRDTEQRVRSMAMIHEQLYNRKEIASVDLADYVQKLAPQLLSSYERGNSISLRLDLASTTLPLERAIPCGLILNELITNALKYAYPDGKGEILVRVTSDSNDISLTVADQGPGLPGGLDWKNPKSLGITIIRALAKQLGGEIELGPSPGTEIVLRIPRELETPFLSTVQAVETRMPALEA
jgi:two-component sensor histidine kinase